MVDVNEPLFSELNLRGVGMRYLFLLQRWICLCLSGYLVFLCNPRWKSHPCQSLCQKFSWLQGFPELIFQWLWGFAPLLGMECVPPCLCLIPQIWLLERALLGTESKHCFASPSSSYPHSFKWGKEQSLHLLTPFFLYCARFFFFSKNPNHKHSPPPRQHFKVIGI